MFQICFKVTRQKANSLPWVQTYSLEVDPSYTILECLNQIKWQQDGTLAFRKNCRNTICGSCAMRINGRAALACKENVQQEVSRFRPSSAPLLMAEENTTDSPVPEITVAPMGNMPVLKDLVVDMSRFWQNLETIDPYISTAGRQIPEREFLQSPADRAKLDQMGNCILCGACYSECNAREVSDEFVGPHALAKAYRTLADTRDQATATRLATYNQGLAGVWGCTRCFNCNSACPMEVAPLDQISNIKAEILERENKRSSRPIRHRKVLVELVQQGGWIDERQFGIKVVGNEFRDLRGLLSLLPLGFSMIRRGKFPTAFEASTGTETVRSLINSVKMRESSSKKSMMSSTSDAESNPNLQNDDDPDRSEPGFGWTAYAEKINGRFAMIGFIILLIVQWFTHEDFFTWIGLR